MTCGASQQLLCPDLTDGLQVAVWIAAGLCQPCEPFLEMEWIVAGLQVYRVHGLHNVTCLDCRRSRRHTLSESVCAGGDRDQRLLSRFPSDAWQTFVVGQSLPTDAGCSTVCAASPRCCRLLAVRHVARRTFATSSCGWAAHVVSGAACWGRLVGATREKLPLPCRSDQFGEQAARGSRPDAASRTQLKVQHRSCSICVARSADSGVAPSSGAIWERPQHACRPMTNSTPPPVA